MTDITVAIMNQRAARAVRTEGKLLLLLAAAGGILTLLIATLFGASLPAELTDLSQVNDPDNAGELAGAYLVTLLLSWIINITLLMFWGRVVAPQPQAPLAGGAGVALPRIGRTMLLTVKVVLICIAALAAVLLGGSLILGLIGVSQTWASALISVLMLALLLMTIATLHAGVSGISIGMNPSLEDLDLLVKPRLGKLIIWTFSIGLLTYLASQLMTSALSGISGEDLGPLNMAMGTALGILSQAYVMAGVMALPDFTEFCGGDDVYRRPEEPVQARVNLDDEL